MSVRGPLALVDLIRIHRHLDYSYGIVQTHGGEVCQSVGCAILACWLEKQDSGFQTAYQLARHDKSDIVGAVNQPCFF